METPQPPLISERRQEALGLGSIATLPRLSGCSEPRQPPDARVMLRNCGRRELWNLVFRARPQPRPRSHRGTRLHHLSIGTDGDGAFRGGAFLSGSRETPPGR